MKNEWKLAIILEGNALSKIETSLNIRLPSKIKDFLRSNNASSPINGFFDTSKSKEEVLNSILNFNNDSLESFYDAFTSIRHLLKPNYIPLAKDGFGNYICVDTSNESCAVYFYDHETQSCIFVSKTFEEFLNSLYGEQK